MGVIGTATGPGDIEELQRLVEKAVPFLETADGVNALRILKAIAATCVDDWLNYSHGSDEHLYELFGDLARLMAEAALMSDLAADERDALAETLQDWQRRLEEYGVADGFRVAICALQTGWDDPALAAVITGKGRSWPPSGTDDRLEEQLTDVRLRVLEACGRTDEYLNLARAARAHTSYAAMLVKLKRTPEAVKHALKIVQAARPGACACQGAARISSAR